MERPGREPGSATSLSVTLGELATVRSISYPVCTKARCCPDAVLPYSVRCSKE